MGYWVMWTDEILEEIHQIREEYAKCFNSNLDEIFADLRNKEAESGKKVVNLLQKPDLTTHESRSIKDINCESK